jgi:dihydrolipoamide dehydrogenase
MTTKYDIAIIGSGPGGYVAALRAAHLGNRVCIIEKRQIGGTCLNRGCIPTKAYAASRDVLYKVQNAAGFGIDVQSAVVDFGRIFDRKNSIVKNVRKSVANLLKGNKVDIIKGAGRLVDKNTIKVTTKGGVESNVRADNIIIATGSKPLKLPALKIDHKNVLTSNDVLKMDTLPKDMVIIGGGIIGCEFASIFSAFGVKITIVELLDNILPTVDPQIANIIRTNGVYLNLSICESLKTEKVLVSAGRVPNISGIGLEELGIRLDGATVAVDDEMRTSVKNIFAIGDVTAGPMLAHKASNDGICAVHSALGLGAHNVPFANIPSVVFTNPEIAYVGVNEKEAKEKKVEYTCGRFSYAASSKAACMGESTGLIKIIAKKDSGVIIGATICGAHASDLIYGLGVAIDKKLMAKDVYETVFAHPTLCEGVKEALEEIDGLAVHKIKLPVTASRLPMADSKKTAARSGKKD